MNGIKVTTWKSPCDFRDWTGPFDIIGDVHGCYDELVALLMTLDYRPVTRVSPMYWTHPQGRRVVFVGDLLDRGPKPLRAFDLARNMVEYGQALFVVGNHEDRLIRRLSAKTPAEWLAGNSDELIHGLATTLNDLINLDDAEIGVRLRFIQGLPPHVVLDHGRLIVVHAALREGMLFKTSKEVREFCQQGPRISEREEDGSEKITRIDWVKDYEGFPRIVYGHYHVPFPRVENNTVCVDTQSSSGGRLTAYRYPEDDFVSVEAPCCYYIDPAYTEN